VPKIAPLRRVRPGSCPPRVAAPLATPCASSTPAAFVEFDRALDAARACARCPIATACLVEALRLDQAYAAGEDLFGITGCWGGVWFEPGRMPRRLPVGTA